MRYSEGQRPTDINIPSPPDKVKQPLLQIELYDINSVPRVFHKGEEITGKVKVSFEWKTNTDTSKSTPEIYIEHVEGGDEGLPYSKVIQYKSSFHKGG